MGAGIATLGACWPRSLRMGCSLPAEGGSPESCTAPGASPGEDGAPSTCTHLQWDPSQTCWGGAPGTHMLLRAAPSVTSVHIDSLARPGGEAVFIQARMCGDPTTKRCSSECTARTQPAAAWPHHSRSLGCMQTGRMHAHSNAAALKGTLTAWLTVRVQVRASKLRMHLDFSGRERWQRVLLITGEPDFSG